MKQLTIVLIIVLSSMVTWAQAPEKPNSAEIYESIKKLNVLGTALYVAAHPDDENTRMIAFLANEKHINTTYLSLTRGDGGQNLIGPEIRELLGVIRTQELLAARRIDGGKQRFSRANDFGYSKNPDETLEIWTEQEVLADVVFTIRLLRPDVIINRFSHDSGRRTHGHHTTSAILSHRAFDLAADPTVFPEQLEYVDVWQPSRLFFNTSWWFYGSRENFAKADKSKMISVDVGTYYPTLGKSNNEIAAESRSQHLCQGFGRTSDRGSETEYLQLLKGKEFSAKKDPFEDINTSWSRVKGGAPIGKLMDQILKNFNFDRPWDSVEDLLSARKLIQNLPEGHWKNIKLEEINTVIRHAAGLYLEAAADEDTATPGQQIEVTLEAINRSDLDMELVGFKYLLTGTDSTLNQSLNPNQDFKWTKRYSIPPDASITSPYWLNDEASLGMYSVPEQEMRGLPETPRPTKVEWTIALLGETITYTSTILYKEGNPAKGEIYRPFEILPAASVNIDEPVYVFADENAKTVGVVVKAWTANLQGTLRLDLPEGWKSEPETIDINFEQKGTERLFRFELFPPSDQNVGELKAQLEVDGRIYNERVDLIDYDHIPRQTVLTTSKAKIVRIDLKRKGDNIGYIMGAGDAIPESLEQIGYSVDVLSDKEMNLENFKKYDAVILGVRAFNTVDRLKFVTEDLQNYVEQGGTVVVQYNTSFRLKTKDVAPYPLTLSRDRVTVEEAEVRFLAPEHQVLNYPNKITDADFDGWVQERGLYFPNEWDENFTAILSANDPGEDPKDGGLLVAEYGKGYYIYTGYSWFRELPAGVPGAYRIFTNLISIGTP
ncbi:MAG: PIG-L family deacetylase [Bacteroidota bacterium]